MDDILFWVAERYGDGNSAARIKRTCRSCNNTVTERILCLALARTLHRPRGYGLICLADRFRKERPADRQFSKVLCIMHERTNLDDEDIFQTWNVGLGVVLGVAALCGYKEVVEAVLRRGPRDGTVVARRLSVRGGHPAITRRLLGLLGSQPPDVCHPKAYVTAVMAAVAGTGHEHVLRAFLEYKPGPDAVGCALVEAATKGKEKITRLLLEVCSNHILNAEDWVDNVPTIIRESGLTLRDRFGERPTIVTGDATSALVVAASLGHTKVVDLLLDHVSFNINDRRPLLAASNKGYVEIVKLLLEKRDNMTIHVRQALLVAGNREVAEVLRKRLRLEGM